MMESSSFKMSRRNLLRMAGAATSAALLTRMERVVRAAPTPEAPKLLVIWFGGGYSQIFSDAGPIVDKYFGVTAGNVFEPSPGCGFLADTSFRALPAAALASMASVGVNHGSSNHEVATSLMLEAPSGLHYTKTLAKAMGGDCPLKAAEIWSFGGQPVHREHVEVVRNIDGAMAALAGVVASGPKRTVAEKAMTASRTMSQSNFGMNPYALGGVREGYDIGVASLGRAIPSFDVAAISAAYPTGIWDQTLPGYPRGGAFALAEVLFRLGVNAVTIPIQNWDHHDDPNGNKPRTDIQDVLPPLATLLERMRDPALNANLVTVLAGEFTRSVPNSDHGTCLSANVIGKYVRPGSTGQQDGQGNMQSTAKDPRQFWAFLSDALRVPTNPFGANSEHQSLLVP